MNFTEYMGANEPFPMFFVKFGEEEHIQALKAGNMHMKNLQYFIELEKRSGIKGRGDKLEGSHVLADLEFSIVDPETDEVVLGGHAGSANFRSDWVLKKPLYCLFTITSDMFVLSKTENGNKVFTLEFTDEQKEKIYSDFGRSALFFPYEPFINQIDNYFKEQGIEYKRNSVKYYDFTINDSERTALLGDILGVVNVCFTKNLEYKYQNEFRILLTNRDTEEFIDINIGEISNSAILQTERLLSNEFAIKVPTKEDNEQLN